MRYNKIKVMTFHRTPYSTHLCVCHWNPERPTVGFDAFGFIWDAITDDYGNIVFTKQE